MKRFTSIFLPFLVIVVATGCQKRHEETQKSPTQKTDITDIIKPIVENIPENIARDIAVETLTSLKNNGSHSIDASLISPDFLSLQRNAFKTADPNTYLPERFILDSNDASVEKSTKTITCEGKRLDNIAEHLTDLLPIVFRNAPPPALPARLQLLAKKILAGELQQVDCSDHSSYLIALSSQPTQKQGTDPNKPLKKEKIIIAQSLILPTTNQPPKEEESKKAAVKKSDDDQKDDPSNEDGPIQLAAEEIKPKPPEDDDLQEITLKIELLDDNTIEKKRNKIGEIRVDDVDYSPPAQLVGIEGKKPLKIQYVDDNYYETPVVVVPKQPKAVPDLKEKENDSVTLYLLVIPKSATTAPKTESEQSTKNT